MSSFGDWLKQERDRRGWSQEQLGSAVDLSKAQISRLESGVQGTKRTTVVRIANALGASVNDALDALVADTPGAVVREESVRYITDPDTAIVAEAYEGLPPEVKRYVRGQVLSAAELARELDRKETIGGTRSDIDANPTEEFED